MSSLEVQQKWALKKYAIWENECWKDIQIDEQHSFLMLSCSQIIIASKDICLESLHLLGGSGQIELFYANANIELHVTKKTTGTSKFRIQLADGYRKKSGIENCLEVTNKLKAFMPVSHYSSYNTPQSEEHKKLYESARKSLEEGKFDAASTLESFMKSSTSKDSISRFLLDPQSSMLVNKCLGFINNKK